LYSFQISREFAGLAVLRKLPDSALSRAGQHSERGAVKVTDLIQYMVDHLDRHVGFIHAKRAKMGKEMW
jgi:hypothetical protein